MKVAKEDGDHESDNNQNARDRQVGGIPSFPGSSGFSDFGKEPVAEKKCGYEYRDRFKDGHKRNNTPVDRIKWMGREATPFST